MAFALLIVSLAVLAWFVRNDVRNFERFRQIDDTRIRQRKFLRWAGISCAAYAGMPLIGLALLGRLDTLLEIPQEFWPVVSQLPMVDVAPLAWGAAGGLVLGGAMLVVLAKRRRGKPAKPSVALDITPMLPRNRAEMLHILPLIASAAISEEIFFRAYLPLLLMLVGANGWIAFAASGLLFGLLHRYQGWLGVVMTLVMSIAFAWIYLGSGSLLLAMFVHLLINLNAMLLRPAIQRRFGNPAD